MQTVHLIITLILILLITIQQNGSESGMGSLEGNSDSNIGKAHLSGVQKVTIFVSALFFASSLFVYFGVFN